MAIKYEVNGIDARRWNIARGSAYRTPVTVKSKLLECRLYVD